MIAYILSAIIVLPITWLIGFVVSILIGLLVASIYPKLNKKIITVIIGFVTGIVIFFLTKTLFLLVHTQFNFIPLLIVGIEYSVLLLVNHKDQDLYNILGIWMGLIVLYI